MIPVRLLVENFLPYRNPGPLDLTGVHIACLTGHNGAGKSSLLDAMTWALWGKARDGKPSDDELIYHNATDMQVQFEFELGGQRYLVVRKRSKSKRGQTVLELQVQEAESGRWRGLSEATLRATQDKITALLRMDYDTFCNSAFLQQGQADAFTKKAPADRKKILYDILGLAKWEDYEQRAKDQVARLKVELQVLEREIASLDAELRRRPDYEAALTTAREEVVAVAAQLAAAEVEVRNADEARQRVVQLKRDRESLTLRLKQEQTELAGIEAELARLLKQSDPAQVQAAIEQAEARLADLDAAEAQREAVRQQAGELSNLVAALRGENGALEQEGNSLNKRLETLRDATEALCPTCGQPLSEEKRLELVDTLMADRDARRQRWADNGARMKEMQREVSTLETEQRQLDGQLRERPALQRQIADLRGQLGRAEEAAQNRQLHQTRLTRWQAIVAELTEQLTTNQREVGAGEAIVSAAEDKLRAVQQLRFQQTEAQQKLGGAQQALSALDALVERRLQKLNEQQQKGEELRLLDILRVAFGRTGVPAMIIEAAVPEIEENANALLGRMTSGRMTVAFETQRETKQGNVRETLDIQIADELGTRAYEMYSGGEAYRVNFAIRVALSKLLARRAGAELRTLMIDEGFGTQDAQGREHLVDAITAIQADFDRILVITHIEELKDAFPVRIEVRKTDQGSVFELV